MLQCSAMYRINRNIVECKDFGSISSSSSATVLIETLWNVKDTQSVCFASPRTGINRNIVECKGIFTNPTTPVTFRINRNIVECKEDFTVFQLQSGFLY